MPERRRKLLEDDWVIVAGNRRDRPSDFDYHVEPVSSTEPCPFDPNEEERTPPEIDRIPARTKDDIPWRVRAVPNKFPAVQRTPSPKEPGELSSRTKSAVGHHEVLVESPEHDSSLNEFDGEQTNAVLNLYQRRLRDLTDGSNVSFVRVFRNTGARAGGSLAHPHSQLVALPFVPADVRRRRDLTRERYLEQGECPTCRMIRRELDSGTRIVRRTERFLVLCPYASEVPYETWILPKKHSDRFLTLSDSARRKLADILPSVADRLSNVLDEPAYNLVLRDDLAGRVPSSEQSKFHHWFLRFVPRIKVRGGFELSTGIPINSVPPEDAAEDLHHAG